MLKKSNVVTNCQVCGSRVKKVAEISGYFEGSKFEIFECDSCETQFTDFQDNYSKLYDQIYRHAIYLPGYNRYFYLKENIKEKKFPLEYLSNFEESYQKVINFLKSRIDYKDRSNYKIIEIGSGYGYLTYALNFEGYNCSGIDVSRHVVQEAIEQFGEYYKSIDLFKIDDKVKFDFIILTEVIEHVEKPQLFIDKLYGLLNKDGCLVLTTPQKCPETKIPFYTELPPVHRWWFSKKSLECLMKKAGFKHYQEFKINDSYRIALKNVKNFNREPYFNQNFDQIIYEKFDPDVFHKKSWIKYIVTKSSLIFKIFNYLSTLLFNKSYALTNCDETICIYAVK
jgi:2-polyprenyl-3-methyl-5-hydroxy-6-metoxy-1,4-benzoquinol methylase